MGVHLRTLGQRDVARLQEFLDVEPVTNLFLASKVNEMGLDRRRLGRVHVLERDGEITAALLDGGSVFVTGNDQDAILPFARELGILRRTTSILGPSHMALPLHEKLSELYGDMWGLCANVRRVQPLMVLDRDPLTPPDPRVRRLGLDVFQSYLEASVHMYTEEIGSSPFKYGGGYDTFVKDRLRAGDAWGIVEDGEVIFKADLGPKFFPQAQLQGVWIKPELRGFGLAGPALSGMLRDARRRFPVISLYVNDFNAPAVRSYRRLGFQDVGSLSTVHY